jgi:hypothetical protein
MMKALTGTIAAGVAVACTAATALAPAAHADSGSPSTTSTLAAIQSRAAAAISVRDHSLQVAITDVTYNPYLTSGNRATILGTLNSDLAGLSALAPVIQADTTVSQARTDYQTIFTHYRVFALALPQARFAAAADDLSGTVVPRLTDAQSRLTALLSGPDKSKDTPGVQADMADLAKQISGITTSTSGLAATVLAFTPAQYDANHALLTPCRADLVTARSDARTARTDIANVVEVLK